METFVNGTLIYSRALSWVRKPDAKFLHLAAVAFGPLLINQEVNEESGICKTRH